MTTPQLSRPPADLAAAPPTPDSNPALLPRTTALREAATFVGLVFLILIGTALALPHAPGVTTPLLAMQAPVFVVALIVVFRT